MEIYSCWKTQPVRGGNGYGSTPEVQGIHLPSSSDAYSQAEEALYCGGNASWGSGGYSGGSGGIDNFKTFMMVVRVMEEVELWRCWWQVELEQE